MATASSEFFNGGIVTSRHPALLSEGELQIAEDCVYRDKDPAIWRAPGRVALSNTAVVANSAIKGLTQLTWDATRPGAILAYAGTSLYYGSMTSVGENSVASFSPVTTSGQIVVSQASTGDNTDVTVRAEIQISVASVAGTPSVVTLTTGASQETLARYLRVGMSVISVGGLVVPAGTTIAGISGLLITLSGNLTGTLGTSAVATFSYGLTSAAVGARMYYVKSLPTKTGGAASAPTADMIDNNISMILQSVSSGTWTISGAGKTPVTNRIFETGQHLVVLSHGVPTSLSSTGGTDEILDTAFYGSSYFLWNGRDPIQRLDWRSTAAAGNNAATTGAAPEVLCARPVGLNPVTDLFTVTQQTGFIAGTASWAWPPSLGTGYFWFMLVEAFSESSDPTKNPLIESVYLGKTQDNASSAAGVPIPVAVPGLNNGVMLTTPATGATNDGRGGRFANYWGVYMAGPTQDTSEPPPIATFRRVALVPIKMSTSNVYGASQAINLTATKSDQGWKYPTALVVPAVGAPLDGRPPMTNEGNLIVRDGRYAESKSGQSTDGSEQDLGVSGVKAFSFNNTAAGIVPSGITVAITGEADPSGNAGREAGYYFYVRTAGGKRGFVVYGGFGNDKTATNYHGGEYDTLGLTLGNSDLDGIEVIIGKTSTGSRQRLRIDSIAVFLHLTSGTMNLNGPPYRVVTFRDQIGMTVSEPAMVPMASCSTGDFFQGFLVTNDLADETAIRWSLATNPEVQPKPYVMRFNSKRKDTITLVKSLGSVLIVGLRDSIKRVNYLPTEIDTDFSQGIAHEDLAVDHGIAGPLAACRFDMPGQGTVLAYASSAGMFLTNGINVRPLSGDLDWPNTVKLSALSSSVLRVYPKEKWLAFYYCPAGASHNRNTRVLYFTYQSDKIKNGSLPAIGPCKVSARSVAEASLNGDTYLITGHEHDGKIYVEDSGLTIPTGYQARSLSDVAENVTIVPRIRTRKMYPAGIARDAREEKLYLLYSKYGATVSVTGCTTTGGSTTVAKTGLDAAVKVGMKVTGDSIQPGTIVTARSTDSFTMSLPAYSDTAGGGKSLTFDSGTLAVSVRGSGVAEDPSKFDTQYVSTRIGDLLVAHNDNARQGIELEIQKVPITYDADGNATLTADLSTNMRIHQFTWMLGDTGNEQNRSTI